MKIFHLASGSIAAIAIITSTLPALAGANFSDVTGPNVSDITGPNVSDITGPNTSDNTGTHTSATQNATRTTANQLADDIGEAYAACGGGDCPELFVLLEQAAVLLGNEIGVAAE